MTVISWSSQCVSYVASFEFKFEFEGGCSRGASASASERPDIFQAQAPAQAQTLVGSAVAHRTTEADKRPIPPASEARVVR